MQDKARVRSLMPAETVFLVIFMYPTVNIASLEVAAVVDALLLFMGEAAREEMLP
jgi:hypothetical protein